MAEPTQAELLALWKKTEDAKERDKKRSQAASRATRKLVTKYRDEYDRLYKAELG